MESHSKDGMAQIIFYLYQMNNSAGEPFRLGDKGVVQRSLKEIGTSDDLIRPLHHGAEAGYDGDSGLDIAVPIGTPVIAAANGRIVYAEKGHTPWQRSDPNTGEYIDTPYSVLIELENPIKNNEGKTAKYIWYTHLSKLNIEKKDGNSEIIPIKQGDVSGYSGTANNSPHLHFGVLSERSQNEGECFSVQDIRQLLGLKEKQSW